jgi:hypothetical protein
MKEKSEKTSKADKSMKQETSKQQTNNNNLLRPMAGTATSSPTMKKHHAQIKSFARRLLIPKPFFDGFAV